MCKGSLQGVEHAALESCATSKPPQGDINTGSREAGSGPVILVSSVTLKVGT